MDRVADLMVDVLRNTEPGQGGGAKAKYALDGRRPAARPPALREMLAAHPLYPGLEV